jgi:hypothetical protein
MRTTQRLQLTQQLGGYVRLAHQDRLGDLEGQIARIEAAVLERGAHLLDELGAFQLPRRDVHRDAFR